MFLAINSLIWIFNEVLMSIWNLRVVYSQFGSYMFKVNNRNLRARHEVCPKVTIKIINLAILTTNSAFVINFDNFSQFVSIVKFGQVNTGRSSSMIYSARNRLFKSNISPIKPSVFCHNFLTPILVVQI